MTVKFTLLGGSSAELPSERGAALMLKSTALSAGTGKRSGIRLCRDLENVGARVTTAADRQKV